MRICNYCLLYFFLLYLYMLFLILIFNGCFFECPAIKMLVGPSAPPMIEIVFLLFCSIRLFLTNSDCYNLSQFHLLALRARSIPRFQLGQFRFIKFPNYNLLIILVIHLNNLYILYLISEMLRSNIVMHINPTMLIIVIIPQQIIPSFEYFLLFSSFIYIFSLYFIISDSSTSNVNASIFA